MSLRFICIEVRKNLHCANVFLQFDQSLTETEFLKIHVDNDVIRLKEYSTETSVSVSGHFAIEARTMSNLVVEECNASFRLTIDDITEDSGGDVGSNALSESKDPKPHIQTRETAVILCNNCESALCDEQEFQRILQFPSGSIDMGEFFCHHGPDFGQVLVPQTQDLFYGFQFLVLNSQLLQAKTKEKEKHLYCRRCLNYLGETLFNSKAVKIWCDSLLMKTSNTNVGAHEIFAKTSFSSTCQLLQKIISETTLDNEPLHQMQFSKVLLEATFPDRQSRFLLLHVLEKHLDILRNNQPLAHGSLHNNNVLEVKLEQFKCFKLLYRMMAEQEQVDDDDVDRSDAPLLAFWKQDITIHTLKVSPTMFSELLTELEENALLLPEIYRFTNDGFQLSYVFYRS